MLRGLRTPLLLTLLLLLLRAPAPATALYSVDPLDPTARAPAKPCGALGRALMAAAHETGDMELGTAVSTIIEKGFLPRIVVTWEAFHAPPEPGAHVLEWWKEDVDPCADLARIRATARAYVNQTYPGGHLEGGRTYRSNEDPPQVWRVNWYVDSSFVMVYVDTETWRAWED